MIALQVKFLFIPHDDMNTFAWHHYDHQHVKLYMVKPIGQFSFLIQQPLIHMH